MSLETIASQAQTNSSTPVSAAAKVLLDNYGLEKQGFQAETITHNNNNAKCTRVSNGNTNYIILEDKVKDKNAKEFFFGILEQYGHNTEFIFTGKEYGRAISSKSAARRTLDHYTKEEKQAMITPTAIEKRAIKRAQFLREQNIRTTPHDITYIEDGKLVTYTVGEVIADRTKSLQEKPMNRKLYEQREVLDTYRIKNNKQVLHGELDPSNLYRNGVKIKQKEFPRAKGYAIGTGYDTPLSARERKNEKARAERKRKNPQPKNQTPSMF